MGEVVLFGGSGVDRDWRVVRAVLPAGWRDAAKSCGAVRWSKGPLADPELLLRVLLGRAAGNHSYSEAADHVRATELVRVSGVAIHKRMRRSADWLEWIVREMLRRPLAALPRQSLRVRLLDATCVSRPGSTGTDFRLHLIIRVPECTISDAELTDAKGGESFTRFVIQFGDVIIGDRCYGTARGVAHVCAAGGYPLVRINGSSLSLYGAKDARVDPLNFARKLAPGGFLEVAVQIRPTGGKPIAGRLCIHALTEEQAEKSQRRARRTKSRKQKRAGERAIENAKYVFVFTTLPRSVAGTAQVLALYRLRWQIELAFKLLKSVCGLAQLPHRTEPPGRAWILAKLLCAVVVERLASWSRAFPPSATR